jgi:hypothetical protein
MMMFFANRNINCLAVHAALVSLAWSTAGIFFTVFLLRGGLLPAQIFLAAAAILALRFALRPLVVVLASRFGLRRALIFGTSLSAIQFPIIAIESRSRKSAQGDKWSFCLMAGTLCSANQERP